MIPISLKMKNFLAYVDEEIDFRELTEPIVLIKGINSESSSPDDNNGAGKSSLLDAILWCVYGRVRGILHSELVKDDIIHLSIDGSKASFGRVEFCFLMEDVYYLITRERKLEGPSTIDVKSSFDMKKWVNHTRSSGVNKRTGKKESSIVRTQEKINDVMNAPCNLFINSAFFEQGNTNTFAISKGSKKSELLREALYLDKWIDFSNVKKLKYKNIEKELAAVEYQLTKYKPKEIKLAIEDNERDIKSEKTSIVRMESQIESCNSEVKKLLKEKVEAEMIYKNQEKYVGDLRDSKGYILDLENRASVFRRNISRLNSQKVTLNRTITACSVDISKFEGRLKKIEKVSVEPAICNYQEFIIPLRDEISTFRGEVRALSASKTNFKGDCPIKESNCSRHSQDIHQSGIKKINSRIFGLNKKISKTFNDLKEKEDCESLQNIKLDEYKQLNSEMENMTRVIADRKNDLKIHEEKIIQIDSDVSDYDDNLQSELKLLEAETEKLAKKVKEFEKFDQIDINQIENNLKSYEIRSRKFKTELKNLEARSISMQNRVVVLKQKLIDIKDVERDFNKLSDDKQVISYTIKMLSKLIPHQLIECSLPEIESYAQDCLNEISLGRMNIELKTQREISEKDKESKENIKVDDLNMIIEVDGVEKKYPLCSGGEKTRTDIAIHLAYSIFTLNRSGAKIRSLFLDEVGMAIDGTGVKALVSLLHRLIGEGGFKKVFIISQDEKLNKLIDCSITVKKTSAGSQICLN